MQHEVMREEEEAKRREEARVRAREAAAVSSLLSQSDGSAVENHSAARVKNTTIVGQRQNTTRAPEHDDGGTAGSHTAPTHPEERDKAHSEAAAGSRSSHSIAPFQKPVESPSRSRGGTQESSRRKTKDPAVGTKAAKAYRLTNQLNYDSEMADGFFDPGTMFVLQSHAYLARNHVRHCPLHADCATDCHDYADMLALITRARH